MADYSFIATPAGAGGAAQINPLASLGQAAQVSNALLGIRARQAVGQAFQQAADPQTGQIDYGKALGAITQDPNAAWMAPQIAQTIQQQQLLGLKLNEAQLAQTQQRNNAINSAMGAFLAKPADQISTSDVTSLLGGMKAAGYPVDEFIADASNTMPSGGQALKDWVTQHWARALPATAQAEVFSPRPIQVDSGGVIGYVDTNPRTNPSLFGTTIGKTLSPEGQMQTGPGPVGPQGQPTVITNAQRAVMTRQGKLVPEGQSQFPGDGRYPSVPGTLRNAGGAQGPSPALPGANPDTGTDVTSPGQGAAYAQGGSAPIVTGLGPQQEVGLKEGGQVGAQQWGAAMQAVGGSAGRQFILQQALHSLQNAPTGPGTDKINYYKSTFQALAPTLASAFGVDPNNVADYDKANKYLTQYAMQQAAARGGTTDSQLATTLTGNASTHISNLAAQQVVQANMALEKMSQAEMQSFQAGLDPTTGKVSGAAPTADQFPNFRARWNQTMDPRAFLSDTLTKDQFLAAAKAGGPKFRNTFNMAIRNNWISPPSWAQQ